MVDQGKTWSTWLPCVMRPSIRQAAHNGLAESCRALMLSQAAVLYLALNACRSMVGALLAVCAAQYLPPFTLGALHWYSLHWLAGVEGIS